MLVLYADNAANIITLFSPAYVAFNMQRTLVTIPTWLEDQGLTVYVAKTQAIADLRRFILGHPVDTPTVKQHGVTIDHRLTMAPHVKDVPYVTRERHHLQGPSYGEPRRVH